MFMDGKPYHFGVGTAWYFDATGRHKVENNSDQDRIHLVVDLKPSDATNKLLKPLTLKDRVRFTYFTLLYYVGIMKTFFTFIWTSDGRARIRARMAIVFRNKGEQEIDGD